MSSWHKRKGNWHKRQIFVCGGAWKFPRILAQGKFPDFLPLINKSLQNICCYFFKVLSIMRVLTIHDSTQPNRKSIITLKNFSFLQKKTFILHHFHLISLPDLHFAQRLRTRMGFIPIHLTKKSGNFRRKFWEKLRFFELLGRENAGSKCYLNSEYFP